MCGWCGSQTGAVLRVHERDESVTMRRNRMMLDCEMMRSNRPDALSMGMRCTLGECDEMISSACTHSRAGM